jgi:hypothetical protein
MTDESQMIVDEEKQSLRTASKHELNPVENNMISYDSDAASSADDGQTRGARVGSHLEVFMHSCLAFLLAGTLICRSIYKSEVKSSRPLYGFTLFSP